MKIRNVILIVSCLFLSSCLVKSLHPFYTQDSVQYTNDFIGNWKDDNKGTWSVISLKDKIIEEEGKTLEEMPKSDQWFYMKHKSSYYVEYTKKGQQAFFLVVPFKINNQFFLDFTPLVMDSDSFYSLERNHLVATHSLVKFDVLEDKSISMKWLDEEKLSKLFKENKIKIKYEKVGVEEDGILLTATSEELQKFIKKYMASNDGKKWETNTDFILTKTDAKP